VSADKSCFGRLPFVRVQRWGARMIKCCFSQTSFQRAASAARSTPPFPCSQMTTRVRLRGGRFRGCMRRSCSFPQPADLHKAVAGFCSGALCGCEVESGSAAGISSAGSRRRYLQLERLAAALNFEIQLHPGGEIAKRSRSELASVRTTGGVPIFVRRSPGLIPDFSADCRDRRSGQDARLLVSRIGRIPRNGC